MDRPRRVLLVGFDAAVPGRFRRFAEAGLLPVSQRLLADGCLARCLPALPTLTTTNWATIATGALPGTHGVTDFNPHRLGDLPDESPQGFDARDTKAEFVWEAAVRGGRDSVVVNWPGSWPPRTWPVGPQGATASGDRLAAANDQLAAAADRQHGADQHTGASGARGDLTIVGGAGIELDEWRIDVPGRDRLVALAAEQRFSTVAGERGAQPVVLPPTGEPFVLPFRYESSFRPVRPALALVCRIGACGGRPVAVFSLAGADVGVPVAADAPAGTRAPVAGVASGAGGLDAGEALAELAEGEWSERLTLPFEVDGETVYAAFRLKLLALDPGAGLFRLYVTDISRVRWLEEPAGALGDTVGYAGLPTPGVGWGSYLAGAIDVGTFVELTDMATSWLADACADVLSRRPCDLFCAHFHAIDSFYHLCAGSLSEQETPDPDERRRYEKAEIAVYRQIDDALGTILDVVGESALVALVSDHGATPPGPAVPLHAILRDAGLLVAGPPSSNDGAGTVDWSRTQAAPQGSCFVRLNLAGREPLGIVSVDDAARVRDEVVAAMRDYRDPATGLCPFSLVATREDAVAFGLGGDGVGDVVYAVRPELSDVHGPKLPDATLPWGDWGMPAVCLFSGTGAGRGSLEGDIGLADVAPTVCHALGVPPPTECDGVVRSGLLAPSLSLETARDGRA